MITTATAMISAMATTPATTPPTMMEMELFVLGLDNVVPVIVPTCSAKAKTILVVY